jgi:hypothetical protein|tara:strand:+ start:14644 stop:15021 length:378 start_codon:yes stop_codon:yes gene_type:complete
MIFEFTFYLCLISGGIVVISMLYLPLEMHTSSEAETPRVRTDKETYTEMVRFYIRELQAPEHEMKRRQALLCAIILVGSISLVLHFTSGAEEAADDWFMPPKKNTYDNSVDINEVKNSVYNDTVD